MRNVIPFRNTTRFDGSDCLIADPVDSLAPTSSIATIAPPRGRQVLSVGSMDDGSLRPETLNPPPGLSFSHAKDYRELWRLCKAITCDAVVFYNSVSCFELEEAARLVRRRWPTAQILLIRSGGITLEDALYDQRLRPPVEPSTLISVLSGEMRIPRGKPRSAWRMAHALRT